MHPTGHRLGHRFMQPIFQTDSRMSHQHQQIAGMLLHIKAYPLSWMTGFDGRFHHLYTRFACLWVLRGRGLAQSPLCQHFLRVRKLAPSRRLVLASKFAFGMKDVKNATSGGGKPKRMSEGVQSGFRKICWMDNGLK